MFRTPTAPVRSLTCTSGFFNQLWGLGFGFKHRVQETACGVQGVGFGFGDVTNVWCSEFRAWGLGFRIWLSSFGLGAFVVWSFASWALIMGLQLLGYGDQRVVMVGERVFFGRGRSMLLGRNWPRNTDRLSGKEVCM